MRPGWGWGFFWGGGGDLDEAAASAASMQFTAVDLRSVFSVHVGPLPPAANRQRSAFSNKNNNYFCLSVFQRRAW